MSADTQALMDQSCDEMRAIEIGYYQKVLELIREDLAPSADNQKMNLLSPESYFHRNYAPRAF